jgi:hypothetical protein
VGLAVVIGAIVAQFRGGLSQWPRTSLLALWVTFGGHWVELFFLNVVRPHVSNARAVRVVVWFAGGVLMATGMGLSGFRIAWWIGGVGFIGVELALHLLLQLSGRASYYNGRG